MSGGAPSRNSWCASAAVPANATSWAASAGQGRQGGSGRATIRGRCAVPRRESSHPAPPPPITTGTRRRSPPTSPMAGPDMGRSTRKERVRYSARSSNVGRPQRNMGPSPRVLSANSPAGAEVSERPSYARRRRARRIAPPATTAATTPAAATSNSGTWFLRPPSFAIAATGSASITTSSVLRTIDRAEMIMAASVRMCAFGSSATLSRHRPRFWLQVSLDTRLAFRTLHLRPGAATSSSETAACSGRAAHPKLGRSTLLVARGYVCFSRNG